MSENLVFVLPDSMEEALWALPVMSQYLENRCVLSRPTGRVMVICKIPELVSLARACWHPVEVLQELSEKDREEADLIIEFDPDAVYEVTKAVEKHIGEAYGVQLGAVAMSLLPPLISPFGITEDPGLVLVVGPTKWDKQREGGVWGARNEFVEMGREVGIPVSDLSVSNFSWDATLRKIATASVVVGVRGSATLVAAAFQKIVMELSPPSWSHRNWMTKWECRRYQMIYGELETVTAEFTWDRTRKWVEQVAKKEVGQWGHPTFQSVAGD